MSNTFSSFCDDFYVNMRLGSQLNLPHQRETLLHFFERVQKKYPGMTRFRKSDGGELTLEEDRSSAAYRWVSVETKRLSSGHVNPASIEEALSLHRFLLELAPYNLGISPVEIDYMDVLFGFDLTFSGNHDEVVAESLLADSPLTCIAEEAGAKAVDVQPTVTFALSDDCRLQCRIDVVTRTNSYQVRTGDYSDDVISVYLILRRYWGDRPKAAMDRIITDMAVRAESLAMRYLIPRVLRPVSSAIASRS
jgi:hypothetical protein